MNTTDDNTSRRHGGRAAGARRPAQRRGRTRSGCSAGPPRTTPTSTPWPASWWRRCTPWTTSPGCCAGRSPATPTPSRTGAAVYDDTRQVDPIERLQFAAIALEELGSAASTARTGRTSSGPRSGTSAPRWPGDRRAGHADAADDRATGGSAPGPKPRAGLRALPRGRVRPQCDGYGCLPDRPVPDAGCPLCAGSPGSPPPCSACARRSHRRARPAEHPHRAEGAGARARPCRPGVPRRRRLSRELGVTEYEARRLLDRARPTTDTTAPGAGHRQPAPPAGAARCGRRGVAVVLQAHRRDHPHPGTVGRPGSKPRPGGLRPPVSGPPWPIRPRW